MFGELISIYSPLIMNFGNLIQLVTHELVKPNHCGCDAMPINIAIVGTHKNRKVLHRRILYAYYMGTMTGSHDHL